MYPQRIMHRRGKKFHHSAFFALLSWSLSKNLARKNLWILPEMAVWAWNTKPIVHRWNCDMVTDFIGSFIVTGIFSEHQRISHRQATNNRLSKVPCNFFEQNGWKKMTEWKTLNEAFRCQPWRFFQERVPMADPTTKLSIKRALRHTPKDPHKQMTTEQIHQQGSIRRLPSKKISHGIANEKNRQWHYSSMMLYLHSLPPKTRYPVSQISFNGMI